MWIEFRKWIKHKHPAHREYDETESLQIYRKCLDEFGGPIRIEPPEGGDSPKEFHMHPDPNRPNIWIPITKKAYDLLDLLGLVK